MFEISQRQISEASGCMYGLNYMRKNELSREKECRWSREAGLRQRLGIFQNIDV